jgi:hypothetical protein
VSLCLIDGDRRSFYYLAGEAGIDTILPNDFFLFFNKAVEPSGLFFIIISNFFYLEIYLGVSIQNVPLIL